MTKNEVRKKIKALCQENSQFLKEESLAICKKILELPQYKEAEEVFAYMALKDEVDLSLVIEDALRKGKKTALPKIISEKEGLMQFFYLKKEEDILKQTEKGCLGIQEPKDEELVPIDASAYDSLKQKKVLILVPGRAFTKEGDRLGRGKGYYDRFLSSFRDCPTITKAGIGFSFQLVQSLPSSPTDIRMDLIL